MNTIVLLNGITIFLHILSGIFISGKGLSKGKIDKREIAVAFGVTISLVLFLFFIDMGNDQAAVVTCVEGVTIFVCGLLFRKVDKRMGLFVSIIYEFAVQLLTLLTGASFIIVTYDKEYLDQFTLRGSLVSFVASIVILLVTIAIFFLRKFSTQFWLKIGAYLTVTSIVCINYLTTIEIEGLEKDEISSWQYYAIVILAAIFTVQMRRQYETEKELAQMKSDEAMILERQYKSLSDSYESNAKLFHDFRNHCGVLKNYLSKGKSDEALEYLEELTGEKSSLNTDIWTGDETVDYLIGSKKERAEANEITFEVEVEFPQNMNIKSSDLCAILGNVLDNAIEACTKVKEKDDRKVRLIIRRIQQMLVIKVENTYDQKPVVINGNYKTSKNDGGLHGWGIKSAQTASEKYDGMVQSSCTDELFTTVVTLSF